jgi:hypothetical protein
MLLRPRRFSAHSPVSVKAAQKNGSEKSFERNRLNAQCRSAIQIVRPCASIADTQPKLHPALLRLSAMSSQSFKVEKMLGLDLPCLAVPCHERQRVALRPATGRQPTPAHCESKGFECRVA